MSEASDGIAEELERQLQLALATGAVIARRAASGRQQALEQAGRESDQAARRVQAQIEQERTLAIAQLQPVHNDGWWQSAQPQEIADMWQQAESWRASEASADAVSPFELASARIREEVQERHGVNPDEILALATVQELEHEQQLPARPSATGSLSEQVPDPEPTPDRGFDDPQRRERLRERLSQEGVPEPAVEARTLADIGQACEAAEATQTAPQPVSASRPARRRGARQRQRQR